MLVLGGQVVRVLGAGVQPRLGTHAGVDVVGGVLRQLVHGDVAPQDLAAVVVDVAEPVTDPVRDALVAQQPQIRLWQAQIGDDDDAEIRLPSISWTPVASPPSTTILSTSCPVKYCTPIFLPADTRRR